MISQQKEKEKYIQKIKQLIIDKEQNDISTRSIKNNWKTAELSLLKHNSLIQQQSIDIYKLLHQLQYAYIEKLVPASYSYFTIFSIFESNNNVCTEIHEQIIKTRNLENNYQNIAVLIFTRNSLIKQQKNTKNDENIEKIRNATILAILKIHEWQLSFRQIISHPVLFYWHESPYLLDLLQQNQELHLPKLTKKYLSEPNPLILHQQYFQQPIIVECIQILKAQKANYLQLSLNIPFYARIINKSSIEKKGKNEQKILRQSSFQRIKKYTRLQNQNSKLDLSSLSQQELNVIKKFRSLKNSKKQLPSIITRQQKMTRYDLNLKNKIEDLNVKVQNKAESSRIQYVKGQKPKTIRNGIKILLQKYVDLKKQAIIDKKEIIDSLNILEQLRNIFNESANKKSQKLMATQRQRYQFKLQKIIKQSRFIIQNRKKSKQQLVQKNESLKSIKQDLIQKVLGKNGQMYKNTNYTIKILRLTSRQADYKTSHEKQKNIQQKIAQQKRLIQLKKSEMLQQNSKIQKQLLQKTSILAQKQRKSKQIQADLLMKKMKINELKFKLQYSKEKEKKISEDYALAEIKKIKRKRMMQYQREKNRITEIKNKLQVTLSQQQKRHAQLNQQQLKRQNLIKQQYQRQIQRIKQYQLQQQQLILQKLQEEKTKDRLYEQKIKHEQQKLMKMQRQLAEWQEKQMSLKKLLRQQQQKQKERQRIQRLQHQKRIQKQITQVQQQQTQFLLKYKETNSIITNQLEELKQKNNLLEKKLLKQ